MSVTRYAVGIVWLMVAVAPVLVAAYSARRKLLPTWTPASARLVELVATVGVLVFVAQVLGSIGAFAAWTVAAASGALGAVLTIVVSVVRRPHSDSEASRRSGSTSRILVILMIAAVSFTVVRWGIGTVSALEQGPQDVDTMTYHLPHAANVVQDRSLTRLHYLTVDDSIPYHPSNGETLHALAMMAFGNDIASPFINLFWLGFTLLGAWVFGERFGRGAHCVIGACVVLATPIMSSTQGGTAMTDIVGIGLMLAAAAIALNAEGSTVGAAVAGWAAGLSLGSKLTMVVPIAVMTLTFLIAAKAEGFRRTRFALAWFSMMIVGGAFWYLRNFFRTGNPIPSLNLRFGGLGFAKVPMRLVDRYGYSVASYATNVHVWRHWFVPGLATAYGRAWLLLFALALAGIIASFVRARSSFVRVMCVTALASLLGYAITPTTALGLRGRPSLFIGNTRYLAPGLILAVLLLAIAPAIDRRAGRVLVSACLAVLLLSDTGGAHVSWKAITLGLAVMVLALISLFRPSLTTVLAAVVTLSALVGGAVLVPVYARNRYSVPAPSAASAARVFVWAQSVHDVKIGTTGFFITYPLFSSDLSNRVSYIGVLGRDHSFTDAADCRTWMREADAGRYDYIVTMPPFANRPEPAAAAWARGDAHLKLLLHYGTASVFRVVGRPDPDACAGAVSGKSNHVVAVPT